MIGKCLKERYYITSFIGEGGMAKVYLADDQINNRQVAIKMIKPETSIDPLNIARFQREVKACSTLSHQNVIGVYDVDDYDSLPYMVMEYIKGNSLRDILTSRGSFSVEESLDITYQLCDALTHAHAHGIIHRDVKPQNVMIQFDGRVKLGDFGIALINDAPQITQKDMVMGSVHYMAPEVAEGKGASPKSDIYSLGITFYELLTGKLPFNDNTPVKIAMMHIKEPFPSVRKIKDTIPAKIEKIIYKACQKNPNNRYLNMKSFKKDVEDMMRIPLNQNMFMLFKKIFKKKESK